MIKKTTYMYDWVSNLNGDSIEQAIKKLSKFNPKFRLNIDTRPGDNVPTPNIIMRETVDDAFDFLKG